MTIGTAEQEQNTLSELNKQPTIDKLHDGYWTCWSMFGEREMIVANKELGKKCNVPRLMSAVLKSIDEQTLRPTKSTLAGWWVLVSLWLKKYRQRRQLSKLDEHKLKDMGLTQEAVAKELQRKFWQ